MAELSERHEIKIRGKDHTIVFLADPGERRLIIRQESGNKEPEEVCTIAISDPAELREFFPNNAIEYFVSYYDYYQPEAYVPSTDTFIEKD